MFQAIDAIGPRWLLAGPPELENKQVSTDAAIRAEGIAKNFGAVRALDHVDLEVPPGKVLGLLGPNGSGKTTLVRVLTTLTLPDDGRAFVQGHDVVREPSSVRRVIGLAGQFSAVDDHLTGFENLQMAGRLYHLDRQLANERANELLERFDLIEAADRPAKTYSGGMKRRLDLAACLVARPPVLFLDEPTTGLDPKSRLDVWEVIRDLVAEGTSLLLTTQYLEEADHLANSIVVIDHGRVIARGTAAELKDTIGGDVLQCRISAPERLDEAVALLAPLGAGPATVDRVTAELRMPVKGSGSSSIVEAVRALDGAHIEIAELALHRPSLDDVFLALTGHLAEDQGLTKVRGKRSGRRQAANQAGGAR